MENSAGKQELQKHPYHMKWRILLISGLNDLDVSKSFWLEKSYRGSTCVTWKRCHHSLENKLPDLQAHLYSVTQSHSKYMLAKLLSMSDLCWQLLDSFSIILILFS